MIHYKVSNGGVETVGCCCIIDRSFESMVVSKKPITVGEVIKTVRKHHEGSVKEDSFSCGRCGREHKALIFEENDAPKMSEKKRRMPKMPPTKSQLENLASMVAEIGVENVVEMAIKSAGGLPMDKKIPPGKNEIHAKHKIRQVRGKAAIAADLVRLL